MDLSNLFNRMIVLFIYIVIGFIAAKCRIIDDDTVKKVNKVLLYVGQPAMIISSVLNSELSMGLGDIVLLFCLAMLMQSILVAIGFATTPLYVRKKEDRGLFRFMIAFGNTGFMGIPVISALFGPSAVFMASICLVPFFLFVYSVGIVQLKGRTPGEKIDFRFLLNPALISTFTAVVLFFLPFKLPGVVLEAASGLSGILIPMSMVIIGANLGMSKFSELFVDWRMYVMCFVKLILSPVVMFAICSLFVRNEVFLGILVVSAAMPVAVLASMLSTEYGTDIQVASRGVFISTLLSLVTIPIMMNILF